MEKYLFAAVAFCMLFVGIFALSFVFDVIRAAWNIKKGKEYKWQSFAMFIDAKEAGTVLLFGAMLCIGVYGFYWAVSDSIRAEYEEPEIKCDICGSLFPEYYETRDSWYDICPLCTNKEINEIVRGNVAVCSICEIQYATDIGMHGMCWDCYLDESAECNWCGDPAPYELAVNEDSYLCTNCMGELLKEKNVSKAIQKILDS